MVYDERHQPYIYEEHGINLLADTDHPAITTWQETIPEDIRTALQGFKTWQISLLQLVKHWDEARDLLQTNPLLLWLTWDHAAKNKWSPGKLTQVLAMKQPAILREIELIGTKSSNKLLRKIDIEELDRYELALIRNVWQNPDLLPRITHQNKLTIRLLRLYKSFPWIAGRPLSKVFDEIDCKWRHRELVILASDCQYMSLRRDNIEHHLSHCTSFERVERLHAQLVEQINAERLERDERYQHRFGRRDEVGNLLPFPEPPHPGNEHIHPILTPEALLDEGVNMKHCVRSYTEQVQAGDYFVYHMDFPEKLTIGVDLKNGKLVSLSQICGKCNKRPSDAAKNTVHQWIIDVLNEK